MWPFDSATCYEYSFFKRKIVLNYFTTFLEVIDKYKNIISAVIKTFPQ